MQSFQIKESPIEYDVVIIGSGAGGGMATYMLGNAGLKVCLLEAGSRVICHLFLFRCI